MKNKTNSYQTTFTIVVSFLVIYWLTKNAIWLNSSLIIGLVCLISAKVNNLIAKLWMKLSYLLSLVFPKIILSIFYLLFLTPIAFLSKTIGRKNYLSLKNNSTSFFVDINKNFEPSTFEKMW